MTDDVHFPENIDAFGKHIADITTNEADIAGHYPFSPERYRIFKNGARQFVQYGSVTEYEDVVDGHVLKPQADGDVVTIETTEKYRYVVGYELEPSLAFKANQSLATGDVLSIAYGDADLENTTDETPGPSADGYIWYTNGADTDRTGTFAIYRNGTEVASETTTFEKGLTVISRISLQLNWYGVGRSKLVETYTQNGDQLNIERASVSVDDGPASQTGNKQIQLSVKVGSTSAGSLEAKLGSVAIKDLGNTAGIARTKSAQFSTSGTAIGTTGTWVPVHAIRVDPDRSIVNVQLTDVSVMEYNASGDVRVLAQTFDQSKLLDAGGNPIVDGDFSIPAEHSAKNSVLESTDAVAQFPDSAGTIGTSATNPGGYQIGYGSLYTTGTNQNSPKERGDRTRKRQVSDRDVVVFLANASATGDVTVEYTTEQDW